MTPTLKILLLIAGIWGLASLILLAALFRAASQPIPEMNLADEWRSRLRRRRKYRSQADRFHPLQR